MPASAPGRWPRRGSSRCRERRGGDRRHRRVRQEHAGRAAARTLRRARPPGRDPAHPLPAAPLVQRARRPARAGPRRLGRARRGRAGGGLRIPAGVPAAGPGAARRGAGAGAVRAQLGRDRGRARHRQPARPAGRLLRHPGAGPDRAARPGPGRGDAADPGPAGHRQLRAHRARTTRSSRSCTPPSAGCCRPSPRPAGRCWCWTGPRRCRPTWPGWSAGWPSWVSRRSWSGGTAAARRRSR